MKSFDVRQLTPTMSSLVSHMSLDHLAEFHYVLDEHYADWLRERGDLELERAFDQVLKLFEVTARAAIKEWKAAAMDPARNSPILQVTLQEHIDKQLDKATEKILEDLNVLLQSQKTEPTSVD